MVSIVSKPFACLPPVLVTLFEFPILLSLNEGQGCILHPNGGLLHFVSNLSQIGNCILQTNALQALIQYLVIV